MRARLVAVALVLLAGCEDRAARARDACFDVEVALASRCPEEPFDEEAARAECAAVDEVRDRDALYAECIPAIEALSCGVEGPLPASCEDQLVEGTR